MVAELERVLVHDLIRRYQSTGRELLYTISGATDVETEAHGSWVTGASGVKYLDFGSYAVFLLGHGHPVVVNAVSEQLRRLAGSCRIFPSEANARAAAAIAGVAPQGLSKVMFLNSGAEAVEAAIKLSRLVTGRSLVMSLEGAFHGKTMGALSLTDAELFSRPFTPLLNEVRRVSRSDAVRATQAIEQMRPAALFVEPIQGEGGIFELASEYLQAVRSTCSATGTILVCDEIQCGLGRCGTMFAGDSSAIVPDVLLLGKALGGGIMPVSALVATPSVFAPYNRDPLLHTSTFGGNPLACAAVLATLSVIDIEQVPSRALELGRQLRGVLERLVLERRQLFTTVSGRGLMLGLHCRSPEIAGEYLRSCIARHLLLTPCLSVPSVIRFTPPATISDLEIEFAEKALLAAAGDTEVELFEN